MNNKELFHAKIEGREQLILPKSSETVVFTLRHADALYQENEAIVSSQNPERAFVPYEQN